MNTRSFCLSRLPQAWRDIGIRFTVRSSVRLSVNICHHPSVEPIVQVRNSETLQDTLTKLGTNIKHHQTM